jgi:uncharacterized protein (DUF433 family)
MPARKKQAPAEPEYVSKKDLFPEPLEVGHYLVADPQVCFGKLTFKGTRLPVNTVLSFLAQGYSIRRIQKNWPYLEREAIEEAIKLAAAGWPELLRPEVEEAINRLAARLVKRAGARSGAAAWARSPAAARP